MKAYAGGRTATWSYHRPLEDYVNGLAACGLTVDCLKEIPTYKVATSGPQAQAQNVLNREIPLFLALRARKGHIWGDIASKARPLAPSLVARFGGGKSVSPRTTRGDHTGQYPPPSPNVGEGAGG